MFIKFIYSKLLFRVSIRIAFSCMYKRMKNSSRSQKNTLLLSFNKESQGWSPDLGQLVQEAGYAVTVRHHLQNAANVDQTTIWLFPSRDCLKFQAGKWEIPLNNEVNLLHPVRVHYNLCMEEKVLTFRKFLQMYQNMKRERSCLWGKK